MKKLHFSRLDFINALLVVTIIVLVWVNQLIEQKSGKALFNIAINEINEIRVSKDNRLQLSMLRSKNGWEITHPIIEAAAENKVSILLAISSARSKLQLNAKQQNLRNFGFSANNLQISFDQFTLQFGDINETSGLRYVLVDNTIALIDDTYFRIASLPAKHYKKNKP